MYVLGSSLDMLGLLILLIVPIDVLVKFIGSRFGIMRDTLRMGELLVFSVCAFCIITFCTLGPMYGDQKLFVDGEYALTADELRHGALIWPWQHERYIVTNTTGSCSHTILEVHQQTEEKLVFGLELEKGVLYTEVDWALRGTCRELLLGSVSYEEWLPEIEAAMLWYRNIRVDHPQFVTIRTPKRVKQD